MLPVFRLGTKEAPLFAVPQRTAPQLPVDDRSFSLNLIGLPPMGLMASEIHPASSLSEKFGPVIGDEGEPAMDVR